MRKTPPRPLVLVRRVRAQYPHPFQNTQHRRWYPLLESISCGSNREQVPGSLRWKLHRATSPCHCFCLQHTASLAHVNAEGVFIIIVIIIIAQSAPTPHLCLTGLPSEKGICHQEGQQGYSAVKNSRKGTVFWYRSVY